MRLAITPKTMTRAADVSCQMSAGLPSSWTLSMIRRKSARPACPANARAITELVRCVSMPGLSKESKRRFIWVLLVFCVGVLVPQFAELAASQPEAGDIPGTIRLILGGGKVFLISTILLVDILYSLAVRIEDGNGEALQGLGLYGAGVMVLAIVSAVLAGLAASVEPVDLWYDEWLWTSIVFGIASAMLTVEGKARFSL